MKEADTEASRTGRADKGEGVARGMGNLRLGMLGQVETWEF